MPNIPERSQMIKEAVSIATGVPIYQMMAHHRSHDSMAARKCALDLYTQNLGFMGGKWIGEQLGINKVDYKRGKLFVGKLTYAYAQHLYDKMVKDAS